MLEKRSAEAFIQYTYLFIVISYLSISTLLLSLRNLV
jgi:hypothetical protein